MLVVCISTLYIGFVRLERLPYSPSRCVGGNKGIVCEHNNVVREKEIGYYRIEYRQMKVGRGKGYQGKEL